MNSVGEAVLDPLNTLNNIGNAILNPIETYNELNKHVFDYVSAIRNGEGDQFAYKTGYLLGSLLAGVVVGEAVKWVADAGKAAMLSRAAVGAKGVANAGEMLGEFGVPKYYTYATEGKSVYVSPHAMKHLEELATHGAGNPSYLRLLGQTYQKALNSAIDDVLSRGSIQFNKMYYSAGNEIMFGAPRSAGELPAVIHFR